MKLSSPILEIQNLKVSFLKAAGRPGETVNAVDGLSLEIGEGAFVSLVGESGSGKSVTALSICRLIVPYRMSGKILFRSQPGVTKEMLGLSAEELLRIRGREISYVFQDPASSLNPLMRVGRQLEEVLATHGGKGRLEAERAAKRSLDSVKLKDPERVYRSFPHELSGGMKQRVMIAMALLSEPRVLIADEPTTALDVMTEADILALLAGLQKERRLTLLFITHNLSLAAAYSDLVYVMQKGHVVERLTKGGDGFCPKEVYTKKLFNAELHHLKPKSLIEV